jgi:hypothetical protein
LEVGSFSYWFDKPWFHTEGRLAAVLTIPSSWGSQLGNQLHAISVHDDLEHMMCQGCGRGAPGRGRQPQFAARRLPLQDDDGLGKPKFTIPKFEGSTYVEEYLTWEIKMEKLWRLHDYTEDKKIKLASSEFDGYALRWWDSIVRERR